MFCPNCGTKIADDAVFCMNCGTKVQTAPAAAPVQPEPVTYQEPITYAEPVPAAPVVEEEPATIPVYEEPEIEAPAAPAYEPPKAAPVCEAPAFEEPAPAYEPPKAAPVYEAPAKESAPADLVIPADYKVPNIILLIVSVLSCCTCVSVAGLVTSIIGLVASCGVKKAAEAGDMDTAERKSKLAKTMWIISAVVVGISIIITLVFVLTGVLGEALASVNL